MTTKQITRAIRHVGAVLAVALALPLAVHADPGKTKDKIDKSRKAFASARAELAVQRKWVQGKRLPSVIETRVSAMEQQLSDRSDEFERAAKTWEAQSTDANEKALAAVMQKQAGGARAPTLPSSLPWGAPKSNKRMPAETKAAWYRQLARDEPVQLAQAGLTTVGGVRFSVLPEAGQAPQDADLAETPEIQLTPAIRAKAAELGRNPLNISNWVRANVAFVPTWGGIQTADATLASRRGNAVDTTTLMLALLRASGIPARYQFGTVDVPVATAMNWFGGLTQPDAALDLLLQGGIAARGLSEGGQIRTIRMEHAWVVAYVNWTPSRGAKDGGAALQPPQHPSTNAQLNAWVPIDASFKPLRLTAGTNLAELAPFSGQAAVDAARQGATCTAASAREVNANALRTHYEQFRAQASQQLAARGDDLRVGQVLGTSVLADGPQPMLPGTLAFPVYFEPAELPKKLYWRLALTLSDGTRDILTIDRPLSQLVGQRLSLSFTPETEADAQVLSALLRPDAGGEAATGLPPRIPAYLARVKAQLRVGDEVVSEGGSFALGTALTLRTLLQNPEENAGTSEAVIAAGETHSWAIVGAGESAQSAQVASQGLAALRNSLIGGTLPAGSIQSGQALQALAQAYASSLDAKSRLYQRAAGTVDFRLPGAVRASSRLETEEAFGLVLNVRPAGIGLHVDRVGGAAASVGSTASAGYTRQTLERASVEANRLIDRVLGTPAAAQSALSGLATMAASKDQTIWRADAASIGQVLATIDADSTVRAELQQAVANGMQGLVAQSVVDLGLLPMDPLVLLDPAAGTAAYVVASRNTPVVQLTAQRSGATGWLGLADAQATKALLQPVLTPLEQQLLTAQALLGDIDNTRWSAFVGQGELLDGLYQARLADAASTSNACDWLISTLASQLATGLPASTRVNHAPVITSVAPGSADAQAPYRYQVVASDPDGDALTYSLVAPPTGMTVNAGGLVEWSSPSAGQFAVTVRVSDGAALAEQSYVLTVGAAGTLSVNLSLQPTIGDPGQTVTLTVTGSSSAGGTITRSATLDGRPLTLGANGVAVFAAPASGAHPVVATVSDGVRTTMREAVLTVRDAAATSGAAISAPASGSEARGVVAISGTATADKFAQYRLQLRRLGEPAQPWVEIGRGLAPVSNGTLGQLDATRYENGLYQIQLVVADVNGVETQATVDVDLVGNLKLGQFRLSFSDIRAEGPGVPLMLTRTYDSLRRDLPGDFGWGWSASGTDISVRKNVMFGGNWEVSTETDPFGFTKNCLRPKGRRLISVTLPDGGLYRFNATNEPDCGVVVPDVSIAFAALPGPTGGPAGRTSGAARLRVIMNDLVQARGGQLLTAEGEIWNPKDFELTTEEGVKYMLREGIGILSVTDPYGNAVTFGRDGYQHNASLGLTLERDAQGRITKATDPAGKSIAYTYNGAGELASVTDREGQVTRFAYATVPGATTGSTSGNVDLQHLLTSITDPRGQVVMSNQFDALGRLTGTSDGNGQAAKQEYDLAVQQQTVTDRRGNRTVYTFDPDGNITRVLNALGEVTEMTYDANGNETSVKNAAGETIERTFDPETGKQLTEKNAAKQTTTTSYPTAGKPWQRTNPRSTTDARGNVTSYTYDSTDRNAVPREIAEPLGRSTTVDLDGKGNLGGLTIAGERLNYGYDAQGRRTSETNGLGHRTTYAYDTNGNETSRTVTKTVNGQTVTFTTSRVYDSENRVVEETDALGGKRRTTYNAAGKVATQTDSLQRVTRYSYDANARLIRTDYPDGTFDSIGYDAEGNEVSRTDRAGRVTRSTFDALNRLVRTDYPDGSFESTEYDAAGRVKATTDRRGQHATMKYDAAGRQTESVDATGRSTAQTYDDNGNRTSVTVDGRTTRYDYDELNRLVKTTWPDGSTHTSVYRTDNRKEKETDPRGVVTSFGYDAAGRLTSVTQSLSATATATTTYGYDETGAKVTQLDAEGRTTTWTIDGNGRVTARRIQDGSQESNQYDVEGNRIGKTTFAGEALTFQYDSENRLRSQLVAQGAASNSAIAASGVIYSYTPSGQLASQQESGATTLSGTQSFRYDANDRLVEMRNPIGVLQWGLDAAGNITERSVSGVGTVRYEYDAAGRMQKVIAPDGKEARYTYDAAGRLVTTERDLNPKDGQPQVLVTYQRYDGADRMVAIAHLTRVGSTETLVAGQAMTRGPGGVISRIDTYRAESTFDVGAGSFSGTPSVTQAFRYDESARLTRETRTKAGVTTDTTYEYSPAGNRVKKTVTSAEGAEISTYRYDAADRLIEETVTLPAVGSRTTTYGWDSNGNLSSKIEPTKATLYRFDPQNRLIDIRTGSSQAEAAAASPGVSYAYDASGNRIRRSTPQRAISYLIDTTHAYAQIASEVTSVQQVAYVRGNDLVRQMRQSATVSEDLFPMQGHLGTSVGAVNADGSVAEEVESDAFGTLLSTGSPKQTHLYTGEYWDQEGGLLYLRARWYDPRTGRFVSADPIEGSQTKPRTLHRYAYASNDPVHRFDPSGRMDIGELATVLKDIGRSAAANAGNFRLVFTKTGCLLVEAIALQVIENGVYIFLDELTGLPYVGKSKNNLDKRIKQHIAEYAKTGARIVGDTLAKFQVVGGKAELQIIEQFILDLVGKGGKVSNGIRALSETRVDKKILRERLAKLHLCK